MVVLLLAVVLDLALADERGANRGWRVAFILLAVGLTAVSSSAADAPVQPSRRRSSGEPCVRRGSCLALLLR
jgi:hypothetical protein